MVNCNPETVSTDYDTSDRLYFEPLTLEDVLHIVERERPYGVIVQFGGQTPLAPAALARRRSLFSASPDSIDQAEDRERFKALLHALDRRNRSSVARPAGHRVARPSDIRHGPALFALGGRAVEIVYDEEMLDDYMTRAVPPPEHPVLMTGTSKTQSRSTSTPAAPGRRHRGSGHIEEAGVHSGDSACSLPPHSLSPAILAEVRQQTDRLARALGVVGLINIQFAVVGGRVYVLEVNPRASRTVPFVSKAIGVPLAQLAARVMGGRTLRDLGFTVEREIPYFAVKEAVFPFAKFPGVDTLLGPEMRSTGEVMGIDREFGLAFLKSQIGAAGPLPERGVVFISLKDQDKEASVEVGRGLAELGYDLMATAGTAAYLRDRGLAVASINKVKEGSPHVVDAMEAGRSPSSSTRFTGPSPSGIRVRSAGPPSTSRSRISTISGPRGGDGPCLGAAREMSVKSLQGIPRMIKKIPMTKAGYEKLRSDLERLVKVERPKNIRPSPRPAPTETCRRTPSTTPQRSASPSSRAGSRSFQAKIAHAQVIDVASIQHSKVVFGATVDLEDGESGEERFYTLVGVDEIDVKRGRISVESPIGRALIGHEVGTW
jgi:carbamoyl-phosphate synthase large subunit